MMQEREYPTKDEFLALARSKFGDDVELAEYMPIIYGSVSLDPFKLTGSLFVYKDAAGKKLAIPVPFGLQWLDACEAPKEAA